MVRLRVGPGGLALVAGPPGARCTALFANGWYIDEYYAALIVTPGKAIAAFTAYRIDVGFIDGIVNGIGSAFRRLAGVGRNIQTGFVRTYAAAVFVGAVAIVVYVGFRL